MIILLGILKRNNKYYMIVSDTEKENSLDDYQFINQFILNNCANVWTSKFLSSKQNPLEYLRGDFDVSKLIIDDFKLQNRIKDFQIITVYYDEYNEVTMYKSIDRAGNISIHDISEFEYTKNSCISGNDISNLPKYVERKPVRDAYSFLDSYVENTNITDLPVRLFKNYLISAKNFKEGYHTVTKVNNGIDFKIHEYLLFNGIITIKLIEYVSEDKKIFMTKQDELSNPYPKERTAGFLSSPLILLGTKRAIQRFCKSGIDTEFEYYNSKAIKMSIPFSDETINLYDKYIKSKDTLFSWQLDIFNNIPLDIYKNILPNEIYKLPSIFYRDMKSTPYGIKRSINFTRDNELINTWIYTVCLPICWQFFSNCLKSALKPVMKNYKDIYMNILTRLMSDVGPKDTLTIMKWTEEHLRTNLGVIIGSEIGVVTEFSSLFSFYQNNYDLPPELKIYSEETIAKYGGYDALKRDYSNPNGQMRQFIIKKLEKIEESLDDETPIVISANIDNSLRQLNYKK